MRNARVKIGGVGGNGEEKEQVHYGDKRRLGGMRSVAERAADQKRKGS